MLNRLINVFTADQPRHHQRHELHLAAGALLIEAASLDGHFDQNERSTIARILKDCFDLSAAEVDELIEAAEAKVTQSTQLFEFTRVIGRHFSAEERIELVEKLCEVVYADGTLHEHEASLLRRIGELVYVSDRDRGDARKRVLRRLGITN
jgi:uncharacterized tellurite resistance protein B-like protein